MHKVPKVKNSRFLERMDWKSEERYRNAKFMHGWHPILKQTPGELTMEPGRFLIKIYFRR